MPRPPGAPPPTPELQRAWENYFRARQGAADAVGALARYNMKHGGSPEDPAFVGLERVAAQKFNEMNAAEQQFKQAKIAANKAAGRGGFPPPAPKSPPKPAVPVCPPNCGGNDNPTMPQIPQGDAPGSSE